MICADEDCCEGCCSVTHPREPILSYLCGLSQGKFYLYGKTCPEQCKCSEVSALGGCEDFCWQEGLRCNDWVQTVLLRQYLARKG